MGLNPSNGISEQLTRRRPFQNVAGLGSREPDQVDAILTAELDAAGIPVDKWPESMRKSSGGEPQSVVTGSLHGWGFRRAWYYWIADGPGIPLAEATALHELHGTSVRVDGNCGCPSPLEANRGFATGKYHVDNAEGLAALADTIRGLYQEPKT